MFVTGTLRYDEYRDANENLQRATTILASKPIKMIIYNHTGPSPKISGFSKFNTMAEISETHI